MTPPAPADHAELPRPARLLGRDELGRVTAQARAQGRRVVFTNGCFDLLHPGHVLYLEEARALGDLLVVGLNDDDSVRRLKGANRPLLPARARATLLLALRCVDYVALFSEDTPEALIHAVVPHILVKGGDYRPEDVVGGAFVRQKGGEVRILAFYPGYSTRGLVERIRRE